MIPESIAFSVIAGIDPQVGLYASFCIAVSIAFFGGRPAVISAATGAMALLMITSVKQFHKHPKQSNVVMLSVVLIVLATHNLALGVFVGVCLSALFLVNKLESEVKVTFKLINSQTLQYPVSGQIFFSSTEKFYQFFDVSASAKHVILDLSHAHIWDITSVNMLNTVVQKFRDQGIDIEVVGLNEASSTLIDRYNPL